MHPFGLSRADDAATAIAAHASDPHLAFIAGGTDILGLIKDRAALPKHLLDINGLADMAHIEAAPDGGLRIGALARMSDVAADQAVRRRFPVIAEALLVFGLRPAAQHGVDRRQPDAAYPLRLFPRRGRRSLQQAPAPAPAARRLTVSIATTRSSAGPRVALPPIPPISPWRWWRSTRLWSCAG